MRTRIQSRIAAIDGGLYFVVGQGWPDGPQHRAASDAWLDEHGGLHEQRGIHQGAFGISLRGTDARRGDDGGARAIQQVHVAVVVNLSVLVGGQPFTNKGRLVDIPQEPRTLDFKFAAFGRAHLQVRQGFARRARVAHAVNVHGHHRRRLRHREGRHDRQAGRLEQPAHAEFVRRAIDQRTAQRHWRTRAPVL
ncbi:hypothetical protein D3C72_1502960 [compost metagenome]